MFSKIILDPPVYACNADLSEELGFSAGLFCQNLLDRLSVHADAVISHIDLNCTRTAKDMDLDLPGASFWLNSMKNGIFYNWLQSEAQNLNLQKGRVFDLIIQSDRASVPILLDGEVIVQQMDFILK